MKWNLLPGDRVRRIELHQTFGGSRQSGIAPSSKSPNIFLFSYTKRGERHGYHDDFQGIFLCYTGEGQRGDQRMTRGNAAIRDHVQDGRALRVFRGAGSGIVEYMGEYELTAIEEDTAHQTDSGSLRKVIQFKLQRK
jgi:hypothetical protein